MGSPQSIYDFMGLRKQLEFQLKHVWDIDKDIPWDLEIDMQRSFLPLDEDSIAFPGATPRQQVVLSQLMGLIVNTTIAEMETVAGKLREIAWRKVLHSYPVNPEMEALGDEFFDEEAKHSELFRRFNTIFCEQNGIDPRDLRMILPNAYGAVFQTAVRRNAEAGGHAFWWVLAVVEEVSVHLYQSIYQHRKKIDPLFYKIHRRHFEEESKHTNYAFLMLELIKERNKSLRGKWHLKTDLVYSELFSTAWVLAELAKMSRVKDLAHKHEFFETLATCLPLMDKMPKYELIRRMFVSAPYVSHILNRHYHKLSTKSADLHGAVALAYPKPQRVATVAVSPEDVWQVAS